MVIPIFFARNYLPGSPGWGEILKKESSPQRLWKIQTTKGKKSKYLIGFRSHSMPGAIYKRRIPL
jgi:hypothetical protein